MTRGLCLPAGLSGETLLSEAIAAIAPQGVRIGCRLIGGGDEAHLLPDEANSIPALHASVRRASGAARWIAHRLLADFGVSDVTVLRTPSGAPLWPEGMVGSLAHDEEMAVAAVAPASEIDCLGIDVEPATPLPDDLVGLVATDTEMSAPVDRRLAGRLVFSTKEAVYKAVYPLDRVILEYDDIAVDLRAGQATTKTGRRVGLAYCLAPRIVVLAYAPLAKGRPGLFQATGLLR